MKILLDECLPLDFRHSFSNHDAHTVEWAGFKGKKNGELLQAAEGADYDVLVTVDQGMPRERHRAIQKLAIIVIRPRTNQVEDLLPRVDLESADDDRTRPNREDRLTEFTGRRA